MSATQLLAEVQRIPGYGAAKRDYEDRFYYKQVLSIIDSRRAELSQFIKEFRPPILNTFNTIDKLVASAAERIGESKPDTLKRYQELIQSHFTLRYSNQAGYLDFLIRHYTMKIDSNAQLIERAKSQASRKSELAKKTLLDLAKEWETKTQQTAEVLKQLKSLRELIGAYAKAALVQHGQKLRFLFDNFKEIDRA